MSLESLLSDLNVDQHLELLNNTWTDILNVIAPLKVFKPKPKSERWLTTEIGKSLDFNLHMRCLSLLFSF